QKVFRELPAGPFIVHITERTPIEVKHSDFAAISPDGGVLTAWDSDGWLHHIDAFSITRIAHRAPAAQTEA
ncbi:MAG TPA: hypothetical protein VEO95_02170, partial [Chthoniobacteraceae bacterium]|nr:hypothetical protein [Chthoniobacteraceae bacterium]